MKDKINLYVLYGWSGFMILCGLVRWFSTQGEVRGSEFGLQITIVNCLAMIMVWLALFGIWFISERSSEKKHG